MTASLNATTPIALITGATSGIGEATAWALAAAGFDLLLTGRRGDRLTKLKNAILEKHDIEVHLAQFDISSKIQVDLFFSENKDLISQIDVLVNNAGLAKGVEKFQDAKISDWEDMIDTNIKGLLYLSRGVLPQMIKKNSGHIVNIGSVAGRWVYPGGAIYCATKYAVRALTEGLRMDLFGTQVRVSNIEPGMVHTEFSEVRLGDKQKADEVYAQMKPLSAKDIADTIAWVINRPPHVNIQELVIFPTDQAAIRMVNRPG